MKQNKKFVSDGPTTGCARNRILLDAEGTPADYELIEVSPAFEKMTGFQVGSLAGKTARAVLSEWLHEAPEWIRLCGKVAIQGGEMETEIHWRKGCKWFRVHVVSFEKYTFTTTFFEITDSKKRTDLVDLFFNQSLHGFFMCMLDEPVEWNEKTDKKTRIEYVLDHQRITRVNQAMLDQYGAEERDFIGLSVRELFNHDLDHAREIWTGLFDQGKWHVETREQKLDGTPMIVEGDYVCMYDEQGRITGHFGVQVEVTEKIRAQEQIQRTKTLLEAAQKMSKMGAWELDLATGRTFWTDEVYAIHEVEKSFDHNKSNGIAFYHPDDRPVIAGAIQESMEKQIPFDVKCKLITAKNNLRWVRSSGYPMMENGQVTKLIGMFQDVTREEADKEAIAREQQFSKQLLENLADGFSLVDADGRQTGVNKAFCEMTGFSAEELLGKSAPYPYWPEEELEKIGLAFQALQEGTQNAFELIFRKRNCERFPVLLSASVLKDEKGNPVNFFANVKDISDLRQMAKEREYQISIFKALFEESPVGIALNDFATGAFLEVNGKLLEPTGYAKAEFLALGYWDITPEEYSPLEEKALAEMQANGCYTTFEKEYIRKDGSRYPVRLRGVLVEDAEGKKLIWSIVEDITERRKAEQALILARQQAEDASRAKSEFLANMSHEIRTPLNGVIGFTELLKMTQLTPVQQEYVDNAHLSGLSLLGIINDILDFSKIEAGQLHLEMIETDMVELISNSVDLVKFQAASHNLELLLNVDRNMPRFAVTDPVRLKQILANLLSNAVKFCEQGEVELRVQYESLAQGRGKFTFRVRDTGIGIDEAQMARLFQAFSQADSSTTRKFGGTGLGLVISDLIARELGSKIRVESLPGEGSTFFFQLETAVKAGEPVEKGRELALNRCLVIDDHSGNRQILRGMMTPWGIECEACEDGLSALEILKNSSPFDVVLCDYHMPYMDGLETIRKIRELFKGKEKDLPLILLHSSSDDESLHKRCDELGVRFRLTKPVKRQELFETLCRLNEDESGKAAKPSPLPVGDDEPALSRPLSILIAEDMEMNRILLKGMLNRISPNAVLHECVNGNEVLKLLQHHVPDLILMDVQMPEMDGIETTKRIRMLQETGKNSLPIIALTAGAFKEEQERCFAAGMNGFLTKPIEIEKLKSALGDCTARSGQGRERTEPLNARFCRETLLMKVGTEDALREILEMALAGFPKLLDKLQTAIEAGDRNSLLQAAHELRGASLNLECSLMAERCASLEAVSLNSESQASLRDALKLLEEEWKRLKPLITHSEWPST